MNFGRKNWDREILVVNHCIRTIRFDENETLRFFFYNDTQNK